MFYSHYNAVCKTTLQDISSVRVQVQLKRLETKVDELLESKSEQNDF